MRDLVERLTTWQEGRLRDLPWRAGAAGGRDAYVVWVSEVMAQQTRLSVVSGYFTRWMARFPTLQSLAEADQQQVLKLWEGLGYYSRARNLHRAAQIVMAEHGGALPRTRSQLLRLPGIGAYTAGAILSLAFGQPEPVLDANVMRVFCRLWDIEEPVDLPATQKRLWHKAGKVVAASKRPGATNEALMELGALVCRVRKPLCGDCPVSSACLARRRGRQELRPVRSPRRQAPRRDFAAAVIREGARDGTRFLISRRPSQGLLGGMWSFPGGPAQPDDKDPREGLRRAVQRELGVTVAVGEQLTTVRHAFTHFSMTLRVYHARIEAGAPAAVGAADWRWTTLEEVEGIPCPVPDRKIIAALRREWVGE